MCKLLKSIFQKSIVKRTGFHESGFTGTSPSLILLPERISFQFSQAEWSPTDNPDSENWYLPIQGKKEKTHL